MNLKILMLLINEFDDSKYGFSLGEILKGTVEMEKHVGDSEYHVLRLQTKTADVTLLNYYCPNDRPLSLDSVTVSDNNFLAVGD